MIKERTKILWVSKRAKDFAPLMPYLNTAVDDFVNLDPVTIHRRLKTVGLKLDREMET